MLYISPSPKLRDGNGSDRNSRTSSTIFKNKRFIQKNKKMLCIKYTNKISNVLHLPFTKILYLAIRLDTTKFLYHFTF